ncbi:MAG: lipoyl(octanoyl) transferase LipB [Myxococcales bacterium]|nr:MAG: lipoyl(octanoyl) transferase LipB [Myxococcales bacterium]
MASSVLEVRYLGTHQPYEASLRLMGALHQQRACDEIPDQLLLLEHNPVITITRQHKTRSLISSIDSIKDDGIEFFEADRGGDATFHGPGQIVGYPIMKLSSNCYDSLAHIEYYMRSLEYALLKSLEELGLKNAMTIPGFAGIWLRQKKLKKLVAIGVGLSQGVTKHGFALNTSIDAKKFTKHIIPCGLKDRDVATLKEAFLEQQLSWPDVSVVLTKLASNIARQFSKTLFWHS